MIKLSLLQRCRLAIVNAQQGTDIPQMWNPDRNLNRTWRSLEHKGLIELLPKGMDGGWFDVLLTEKGKELINSRPVMAWVRDLLTREGGACVEYYIDRLPLEDLPEFLTAKDGTHRRLAIARMVKLQREQSNVVT